MPRDVDAIDDEWLEELLDDPGWWGERDDDVEYICDCGRDTAGDACEQCGTPLCPMCHEVGAGFCRIHPDSYFEPPY